MSTNPKDRIGATKPPLEIIPAVAIILESMVLKLGATKYGPFNWRSETVSYRTYLGAALRHLFAYMDGQNNDTESGISHLAHARAGLGILLDAISLGMAEDDRPTRGMAAETIRSLTATVPVPTTSNFYDLDVDGELERLGRDISLEYRPTSSDNDLDAPIGGDAAAYEMPDPRPLTVYHGNGTTTTYHGDGQYTLNVRGEDFPFGPPLGLPYNGIIDVQGQLPLFDPPHGGYPDAANDGEVWQEDCGEVQTEECIRDRFNKRCAADSDACGCGTNPTVEDMIRILDGEDGIEDRIFIDLSPDTYDVDATSPEHEADITERYRQIVNHPEKYNPDSDYYQWVMREMFKNRPTTPDRGYETEAEEAGYFDEVTRAMETGTGIPVSYEPVSYAREPVELCEDEGCPHYGTAHSCVTLGQMKEAMAQAAEAVGYLHTPVLRGVSPLAELLQETRRNERATEWRDFMEERIRAAMERHYALAAGNVILLCDGPDGIPVICG